jgi:hypothetical protein
MRAQLASTDREFEKNVYSQVTPGPASKYLRKCYRPTRSKVWSLTERDAIKLDSAIADHCCALLLSTDKEILTFWQRIFFFKF